MNACGKDQEDTDRNVRQFIELYRSRLADQTTFDCYYNTADSDDVIAVKVYSKSDVIHSMLWPSLVIVVCCVVFLRLETRRRHLTICGRDDDGPPSPSPSPPRPASRRPTQRDILDSCSMVQLNGTTGVECRLLMHGYPRPPGCNWSSTSALNVHRVDGTGGGGSAALPVVVGMHVPWKSYSSLERLISNTPSQLHIPNHHYGEPDTGTTGINGAGAARKSLPVVVVHHLHQGCGGSSSSTSDLLTRTAATTTTTASDEDGVEGGTGIRRHQRAQSLQQQQRINSQQQLPPLYSPT